MADNNRIKTSEKNKIVDFGKKIGGAKKDIWKKRGLQVYDLINMNEKEMEKNIKKSNVWTNPDYQELVNNGHSVRAAYFIKMIKDSAPTKPVLTRLDDTPEKIKRKQEGYVEFISILKKAVMSVKNDDDILSFYEYNIEPHTIKTGRYVETIDEAYDYINNKLLMFTTLMI